MVEFKVSMSIENEERLQEILRMDADFVRRAHGLFLDVVFQIHKYLIRLTPLDTGELRGGWTSILSKYNQDFTKQILDKSLYDEWKQSNKTQEGREYHIDPTKIAEGASKSFFEDVPFDVTLINAAEQGEYMEYGTAKIQGRHFTELARYKGEYWFDVIFEKWFDKIADEGRITDTGSLADEDIPN